MCVNNAQADFGVGQEHVVVAEAVIGERPQRVRAAEAGLQVEGDRVSGFDFRTDQPAMQGEHDAAAGDRQEPCGLAS